jgi:hypothetical protein
MRQKPSADDVKILLQELRASVPKAECWSCDCLQGFVAPHGKTRMRREAHFRESRKVDGRWDDEFVYAILADEWNQTT